MRRASAAEVDATLRRIFGGAVVVEEEEGAFVTGDFNGDGSADLAVIVHPARSKLSEINDPLSNWTVQDARRAFFSSPHDRVVFRAKASHQIVGASEQLIAVIHGYGAQGWRDRDARQAYLVRNAGRGRLQAIPAPGRVLGAPVSIKHSEVIYQDSEQPGFLFWTGSQYAWRISAKREGGV
ncbi:MAG TPA: hypothetical protein VG498_19765 [Terriglobales bacterium]|nr:hypothetical protein [Terriglobales bacterium]